MPVTAEIARRAGELLGATGLSGHRCAIDAVVAATALVMERPAVLLTSDLDDLSRLVEEPERPMPKRYLPGNVTLTGDLGVSGFACSRGMIPSSR